MKRFAALLILLLVGTLAGCGAMSPDAAATASAQSVAQGETVTLSGAASDKKNGETLTYRWSIVSAPAGSTAQIVNPSSAEPTFTPDMVGEYAFQLVVDNDFHESEPVEVKISCTPAPILPVVNATDPSGLITLQDLTAVENFRTATHVNLILKYSLKNAGTARANIGLIVRGFDQSGAEVYAVALSNAVNAGETKPGNHSLGEVLTVTEYDTITTWTAAPPKRLLLSRNTKPSST